MYQLVNCTSESTFTSQNTVYLKSVCIDFYRFHPFTFLATRAVAFACGNNYILSTATDRLPQSSLSEARSILRRSWRLVQQALWPFGYICASSMILQPSCLPVLICTLSLETSRRKIWCSVVYRFLVMLGLSYSLRFPAFQIDWEWLQTIPVLFLTRMQDCSRHLTGLEWKCYSL